MENPETFLHTNMIICQGIIQGQGKTIPRHGRNSEHFRLKGIIVTCSNNNLISERPAHILSQYNLIGSCSCRGSQLCPCDTNIFTKQVKATKYSWKNKRFFSVDAIFKKFPNTGRPLYLKFQENGEKISSYPKFETSKL